MKIQKLNENMPNLDKVVHNDDLNAVTEMPPTMSDAYIDSVEADKAVEDIIKPAEEIIKEKPFLGAEKQPTPNEPEEAKITLDESLFEDVDSSLRQDIYDFLDELGGYADYNQKIEDVSEEFGMSPDEAEGYVCDWIQDPYRGYDPEWHDTADQEEEEDIPEDVLKDYIDSIEVEEDVDESLVEASTKDYYKEYEDIIRKMNGAQSQEELQEIDRLIQHSKYADDARKGIDDANNYASLQRSLHRRLLQLRDETELTEDAHNKPDCYNDLLGYYHEVIYNSIPVIQETEEAVPGYDGEWCREDMDPQVDKSIDQLAKSLADSAVFYYRGPAEADWSDTTEVDFDESLKQKNLNEDGRSQSLLRQLDDTDIDEEEFDLWTLVYSSLINKPDEATWKAMQKYDTVVLPKKLRYDTINSDSDGNIIVYGKTEKDLDGAKLVADLYELEYEVKPSRGLWAKQHPEQSFSLTIKIPDEEITDIDKYFEK